MPSRIETNPSTPSRIEKPGAQKLTLTSSISDILSSNLGNILSGNMFPYSRPSTTRDKKKSLRQERAELEEGMAAATGAAPGPIQKGLQDELQDILESVKWDEEGRPSLSTADPSPPVRPSAPPLAFMGGGSTSADDVFRMSICAASVNPSPPFQFQPFQPLAPPPATAGDPIRELLSRMAEIKPPSPILTPMATSWGDRTMMGSKFQPLHGPGYNFVKGVQATELNLGAAEPEKESPPSPRAVLTGSVERSIGPPCTWKMSRPAPNTASEGVARGGRSSGGLTRGKVGGSTYQLVGCAKRRFQPGQPRSRIIAGGGSGRLSPARSGGGQPRYRYAPFAQFFDDYFDPPSSHAAPVPNRVPNPVPKPRDIDEVAPPGHWHCNWDSPVSSQAQSPVPAPQDIDEVAPHGHWHCNWDSPVSSQAQSPVPNPQDIDEVAPHGHWHCNWDGPGDELPPKVPSVFDSETDSTPSPSTPAHHQNTARRQGQKELPIRRRPTKKPPTQRSILWASRVSLIPQPPRSSWHPYAGPSGPMPSFSFANFEPYPTPAPKVPPTTGEKQIRDLPGTLARRVKDCGTLHTGYLVTLLACLLTAVLKGFVRMGDEGEEMMYCVFREEAMIWQVGG